MDCGVALKIVSNILLITSWVYSNLAKARVTRVKTPNISDI